MNYWIGTATSTASTNNIEFLLWNNPPQPYTILVGTEGAKMFDEALKQYPYTPEESIQKQEEPELGFLGLVTITNKNEK